jgi:glutamate--cysteine ligase
MSANTTPELTLDSVPSDAAPSPVSTRPSGPCQERLNALPREVLNKLKRGVEKESLRVRPDGTLAVTPHPAPLGSALTHPHITTDFSESQLELITGVHTTAESCLNELT